MILSASSRSPPLVSIVWELTKRAAPNGHLADLAEPMRLTLANRGLKSRSAAIS